MFCSHFIKRVFRKTCIANYEIIEKIILYDCFCHVQLCIVFDWQVLTHYKKPNKTKQKEKHCIKEAHFMDEKHIHVEILLIELS